MTTAQITILLSLCLAIFIFKPDHSYQCVAQYEPEYLELSMK